MSESQPLKVVILGAGFAGLTVATSLDEAAASGLVELTLVDASNDLVFGLSLGSVWTGGNLDDHRLRYDGGANLKAQHARFVNEQIMAVDTASRTVTTSASVLTYDRLVVCTGAQSRPELMPGLAAGPDVFDICSKDQAGLLRDRIATVSSGTVVVMVHSAPYKCPPAPYECAFLVDSVLRERRVREQVRVVLTTYEAKPIALSVDEGARHILPLLSSKVIFS